jgi:putative ABC transport system permease protein
MQSLGYRRGNIGRMIAGELTATVLLATLTGVAGAALYNRLVLYALSNVWQGAVHTENFVANIELQSLLSGSAVSLLICLSTVVLTLRKVLKSVPENACPGNIAVIKQSHGLRTKKKLLTLLLLLALLLLADVAVMQSPVLFMITGIVGLATAVTGYAFLTYRMTVGNIFNRNTVIGRNLYFRRRSGALSVAVLASGLFVVLAVGLHRKDFSNTTGLTVGTGGFSFWGENSVPLYHSLSTAEGRARLSLSSLPAGTVIQQMYRHGGDDASCLNLNRAPQPAVLGVDAAFLADASFTFADANIPQGKSTAADVWAALKKMKGNRFPVVADQTVLQWGLMKAVGDTIVYRNRWGEHVVFEFIGGLNTSIFQGNLLIDQQFFNRIWGSEGSRVMLVQTPEGAQQKARQLLTQALANYGLRLDACSDRLKEFNSVTDSYLTIFLMLGGLGLLIGLFGMLLIIRRGLLERTAEISMLLATGFDTDVIRKQLFRESITVPLYAIITGTLAALIAVASAIPAVGISTWLTMLAIIAFLTALAWGYTMRLITRLVMRQARI